MVAHRDNGHEFALYVEGLSSKVAKKEDTLCIDDAALVHRILHVLRLQKDDQIIFFDRQVHVRAVLDVCTKKTVVCALGIVQPNQPVAPHVSVLLPLLKREAFEDAVYALVELGVQEVRLVHTAKEQRHWTGQKEMQRIYNIAVAAAEQSKFFAIPRFHEPVTLQEVLEHTQGARGIFFDPAGTTLFEVAMQLKNLSHDSIIIAVGPEGDLTDAEKFQLQKAGFYFARLTPTVLRAQQAISVGVGALRSLLV